MAGNRAKGKRYDDEPKLNYKKVFLTVIVLILIVYAFIYLLKPETAKEEITNKRYFSMYQNGKWGVIDEAGNIVIAANYDEMILVPDASKDIFIYTYDIDEETGTYKTKAMNSKKEPLFTNYDLVEVIDNYDSKQNIWYESEVLKVNKNGKYGLIDLEGNEILSCKYDKITSFKGVEENLIIELEGKVGLVNLKGQVIIDTNYKAISELKEGYKSEYIIENEEGLKGIISTSGNIIIEPKYKEIKYIDSSSYFAVYDEAWKIINTKDEAFLVAIYDEIKNIKGENVIVKKDGKYGLTSISGEVKIENQFEDLSYAFSIYYIAKKDNQYGIINLNGETIIPFEYLNMYYVEDGSFIVADKTELETVAFDSNLSQKFIGIISEINKEKGYIRVYDNENYKYYNFKFEEKTAQDFLTKNNLFLSKKDGKYGYLDREGNQVVDYIYEDATEQNEYGFAAVKLNGKWGSIDKIGKRVLEPSVDLDNSLYIDFLGSWHLSSSGLYYTK